MLDEHVRQQQRERLAADQLARAPDRVPETKRLLLAGEARRPGLRQVLPEEIERFVLLPLQQGHLQLELPVEMVFDDRLVAAGDEDEMLDAGLARFVDDMLDQRPVDDRQHLFRHGLGGRQEPGAEPGNGEYGFADEFHVLSCGGRGQMPGTVRFLAQFIVQVSLKVSESQDRSTIGVILARELGRVAVG